MKSGKEREVRNEPRIRELNPKYRLSPKVCSEILNRADRAGKKLPEALVAALLAVSQKERPSGEPR
jgi:hypothetical protein